MSTDIDENGFFFVDGEPVGRVHEADDGNLVLVDPDGRVLDAITPAGEQVDPRDYMPAPDAPAQDFVTRQEFEMSQRLATLEAQVAQQPPQQPAFDPEHVAGQLAARLDGIGHDLGRELTTKEVDAVFQECDAQLSAGRELDLDMAAKNVGLTHADDMTGQEWAAWGTQRLIDADNGDRTAREHYDLDTHEGRTAFMNDRLEGRIDDEQAAALKGDTPAAEPEAAEPAAAEAA